MVYPISNRSDSLEIDFHHVRRQVGRYLGYGYSHQQWGDERAEEVQDIIDEGVRQAYFPPTAGDGKVHEWTFMRPTFEFKTVDGQRKYQLPADFERPHGMISYLRTTNNYAPIQFTSPSRLRNQEARTDYTAPPCYAAIEPDDSSGEAPHGLLLVLHPTPDSEYDLGVEYQSHARRLTAETPFPLGGQAFGPVILASCLAAAEVFSTRQQGTMYQNFLSKLASAIARDHQRGPHVLGYNGDSGAGIYSRSQIRRLGGIYADDATYNGVAYEG